MYAVCRTVGSWIQIVALFVASVACSDSEHDSKGAGGSAGTDATSGAAGEPNPALRTCPLPAPRACPDPAPTYADVEPVFAARCVVCHAGIPNGPWPLNTYGHVATWRDTVRASLIQCTMPPPESGQTIADEESLLVLTWIRCGMPR